MKLIWARGAEANLTDIVLYIARDNVKAALETEDRIRRSVERLAQMPRSGRMGRDAGTYELVVPRTSYTVVYTIQADEIGILRVLHGAQQWPPAQ